MNTKSLFTLSGGKPKPSNILHTFLRAVVSRDSICRAASLFILIVSLRALMTII